MDYLLSIFNFKRSPYSAVHKKDDDSAEKLHQIIQSQPLIPDIHTWTDDKIKIFAKNMFNQLKAFEIDNSNFELIKKHLINHATSCQRLGEAFLHYMKDLKGQPEDLASLRCSLALLTHGKI